VILSDEEIRPHIRRATQTIEIESFVMPRRSRFSTRSLYFLTRGQEIRSTRCCAKRCAELGVLGVARVVLHSKDGCPFWCRRRALTINTIRWAADLRSVENIPLPAAGKRPPGSRSCENGAANVSTCCVPSAGDHADRFSERSCAGGESRQGRKTARVTSLEGDGGLRRARSSISRNCCARACATARRAALGEQRRGDQPHRAKSPAKAAAVAEATAKSLKRAGRTHHRAPRRLTGR
jgi:hypothetical protein